MMDNFSEQGELFEEFVNISEAVDNRLKELFSPALCYIPNEGVSFLKANLVGGLTLITKRRVDSVDFTFVYRNIHEIISANK